jgi:hypothetical protein
MDKGISVKFKNKERVKNTYDLKNNSSSSAKTPDGFFGG